MPESLARTRSTPRDPHSQAVAVRYGAELEELGRVRVTTVRCTVLGEQCSEAVIPDPARHLSHLPHDRRSIDPAFWRTATGRPRRRR
jgi:hypothetical protein